MPAEGEDIMDPKSEGEEEESQPGAGYYNDPVDISRMVADWHADLALTRPRHYDRELRGDDFWDSPTPVSEEPQDVESLPDDNLVLDPLVWGSDCSSSDKEISDDSSSDSSWDDYSRYGRNAENKDEEDLLNVNNIMFKEGDLEDAENANELDEDLINEEGSDGQASKSSDMDQEEDKKKTKKRSVEDSDDDDSDTDDEIYPSIFHYDLSSTTEEERNMNLTPEELSVHKEERFWNVLQVFFGEHEKKIKKKKERAAMKKPLLELMKANQLGTAQPKKGTVDVILPMKE